MTIRFPTRPTSTMSTALALAAALAVGCTAPVDPGDAPARIVDRTVLVQGPVGEPYAGELALTIDDDFADGDLALQGERFDLRYWTAAGANLEINDRATGASLLVEERADAFALTFTIDGRAEVFTSEAALARLDLPGREQHMKLLLAAQVMDDITAEVRQTDVYFPWLIVVIIGAVIVDSCAGTELTCNGPTQVHCPDGSKVTDSCGCGESVCNKCWPSTCADECTPYDPCPEVHPTTTSSDSAPLPR